MNRNLSDIILTATENNNGGTDNCWDMDDNNICSLIDAANANTDSSNIMLPTAVKDNGETDPNDLVNNMSNNQNDPNAVVVQTAGNTDDIMLTIDGNDDELEEDENPGGNQIEVDESSGTFPWTPTE